MEALTADFRVPEGTEALSPRFTLPESWDPASAGSEWASRALPGVGCPVSHGRLTPVTKVVEKQGVPGRRRDPLVEGS